MKISFKNEGKTKTIQTKTETMHFQQTWITRKVKEHFSRSMTADRNLNLNKEGKIYRNA